MGDDNESNVTLVRGILPNTVGRSLVLAAVAAGVLGMLEFASVILLYPVFLDISQGNQTGTQVAGFEIDLPVQWLAVAALSVMIVRSLGYFAYRYVWTKRLARIEGDLYGRVMSDFLYAPYAWHLVNNSSALLSKSVQNVNVLCMAGLASLTVLLADTLLVVALVLALVTISPVAGLAAVLYTVFLVVVYLASTRAISRRLGQNLSERFASVFELSAALLAGTRDLMVFGARQVYLEKAIARRRDVTETQRRVILLADVPKLVLEIGILLPMVFLLLILVNSENTQDALALAALFIMQALRLIPVLGRIMNSSNNIGTAAAMGADLARDLKVVESLGQQGATCESTADSTGSLASGASKNFELKDVTYQYPGGTRPALTDVSLTFPHGSMVGVVGSSGSGKTTLGLVLLGLLTPQSGQVRYCGAPFEGARDSRWERVLAVPQDVFVIDDSLASNVAFGVEQDEGRLWEALQSAGLLEWAESMPAGLDSPLQEAGVAMSTGQRQRLGLARALYRRPEVLVLDEPTGSLDRTTESLVMATILGLVGEMTVIVIAHREHTLERADLVVRMHDGRVTCIGDPSSVLHMESPRPEEMRRGRDETPRVGGGSLL